MNIESILAEILKPLFGTRVWEIETPDDIPRDEDGNFLPFALWSQMGGRDDTYVDQTAWEKTDARVQITAWDISGIEATNLIRKVRDLLLASAYTVEVHGSPVGTNDTARKLKGRMQQYSIFYPE